MNYKYQLIKIISTFITGYGAGIPVVLSFTNVQNGIDWVVVFLYPLISGTAVLFPYFGKLLGEIANEFKKKS